MGETHSELFTIEQHHSIVSPELMMNNSFSSQAKSHLPDSVQKAHQLPFYFRLIINPRLSSLCRAQKFERVK